MIVTDEISQHSILTAGQQLVSWLSSTATFLFYVMLGLRILHFLIFAIRSDAPYPSSNDFFQRLHACFRQLCELWLLAVAAVTPAAIQEDPPQFYKKTELTQNVPNTV